jgi:rhodanese-related sulfurtransferase
MFLFGSKPSTLRNISAAELHNMLAEGTITLVDVREVGEYEQVRIKGALNMPLSGFDPARLPAGEVVLHCGVGKRSAMAADKCAKAGREITGHLAGGLNGWLQAGLPVIAG